MADSKYRHELAKDAETIEVETTYTFDKPGTYFPWFWVSAHRDGSKGAGIPVENLARVRVVVG